MKRIELTAVAVLVAAATMLSACSSGTASTSSGLTIKTVEPNKAETATPPPTPTPVPAITPSPIGFSAQAANAGEFPAPPPNPISEPASTQGIARLSAPGLGVNNYLEVVRVKNNEMETPSDGQYGVGWYPDYGLPGSGGNIVMSAHETWNHQQGPFYGLHKAVLGDEINVKMADGKVLTYKVISNRRYQVDNIPMGQIIWPDIRPKGEEWLTLLTCGGRIVYNGDGFGEYLDRDVVVARRVS